MDDTDRIIKINCILKGTTAQFFEKIKESKGLESNTEVIRSIIKECYDRSFHRSARKEA
jgi:pectin methylesterase-like acyl-CoA thioesterase